MKSKTVYNFANYYYFHEGLFKEGDLKISKLQSRSSPDLSYGLGEVQGVTSSSCPASRGPPGAPGKLRIDFTSVKLYPEFLKFIAL